MWKQSESIGEVAAALCLAQSEFSIVPKDAKNPFFKSTYADLATVVKTVQPVLSKHGLAVVQTMEPSNTGVCVVTTLLHSSGQFISSCLHMTPVKNDPQGIGSCITYARRYCLSAILGVVSEDDDDGNAASAPDKHSTPNMIEKKKEATPLDLARGIFMSYSELGWKKDDIMAKFKEITGKDDMKNLSKGDVSKLEKDLELRRVVKKAEDAGGVVVLEKKLNPEADDLLK